MKNVSLLLIVVSVLSLLVTGCVTDAGNNQTNTTNGMPDINGEHEPSIPPAGMPDINGEHEPSIPAGILPHTAEQAEGLALNFVETEATFKFDGIMDTLKVIKTDGENSPYNVTVEFDCLNGGYGDRSGQAVTNNITHHVAVITVYNGMIHAGVMDGMWDMITEKMI
ncbi:hypothetical protein CUJ83_09835 [Methanocella sp. CWC-04]|uniref:Lipoprotein n=1 Tax=Methanooceanicella nereidis TaxID=2052831 RepID=A0AAP2RDK1_9EURY|nr:hypothetical protein [Methanocella sp. CWC-04]MCD1295299.1 hypothetical protein [Methanocella sp. CWC-04]